MKIWQGKFKNFKSAKKKMVGKSFSSHKWIGNQVNNFDKCQELMKSKKNIPHKLTYRYRSFLKILKKVKEKNSKLCILDYGGGFGLGYFYIIS